METSILNHLDPFTTHKTKPLISGGVDWPLPFPYKDKDQVLLTQVLLKFRLVSWSVTLPPCGHEAFQLLG